MSPYVSAPFMYRGGYFVTLLVLPERMARPGTPGKGAGGWGAEGDSSLIRDSFRTNIISCYSGQTYRIFLHSRRTPFAPRPMVRTHYNPHCTCSFRSTTVRTGGVLVHPPALKRMARDSEW